MPTLEVSTVIPEKKKQAVYALLKEIHKFPSFMRNVKTLDIVEKNGNQLITSWQVEVDGAVIFWKEEDLFDDRQMSLKFKMLEGDYNAYEGEWRLDEVKEGTRLTILANFDWGIPAFEKFVGDILKKKAHKSLRSMLNAIKQRLKEKKEQSHAI